MKSGLVAATLAATVIAIVCTFIHCHTHTLPSSNCHYRHHYCQHHFHCYHHHFKHFRCHKYMSNEPFRLLDLRNTYIQDAAFKPSDFSLRTQVGATWCYLDPDSEQINKRFLFIIIVLVVTVKMTMITKK